MAALGVIDRYPRWSAALAAGLAAVAAGSGAGPVAAALAATYATGAVIVTVRRRRTARAAAAQTATLDTVAELAADLRAGAPPAAVLAAAQPVLSATPAELAAVLAAWQVSERTGAPLADVLDRVEAQIRQERQLRLAAAAHQAGTRATALLLAVLPVGGVALGFGIGADPLDALLGTPLGGGCALAACALQVTGVLWTERLSRIEAQ
jgi:tight adherence protein B